MTRSKSTTPATPRTTSKGIISLVVGSSIVQRYTVDVKHDIGTYSDALAAMHATLQKEGNIAAAPSKDAIKNAANTIWTFEIVGNVKLQTSVIVHKSQCAHCGSASRDNEYCPICSDKSKIKF